MKIIALFLALCSTVGIGQRIFRVRALKLLSPTFQPLALGMCDNVTSKELFAVRMFRPVKIFPSHTFRIGSIDDSDKGQLAERTNGVRLQESRHGFKSASARARRQGPASTNDSRGKRQKQRKDPGESYVTNGLIAHVRFQWPNGRFTSNVRVDSSVAFTCVGPTPYSTDNAAGPLFNLPDPPKPTRIEPVICLPGTDIGIEIENRATLSQGTFSAMIEFRGRLRRFLRTAKGDMLRAGREL